jgi:hypothetical protein
MPQIERLDNLPEPLRQHLIIGCAIAPSASRISINFACGSKRDLMFQKAIGTKIRLLQDLRKRIVPKDVFAPKASCKDEAL